MKLKIDKEFLLKHRFWIMLGVIPLLWLIAWLVLVTSVAEGRDQKRSDFDKLLSSLTKIRDAKNPNHIDPLKKTKDILSDQKNKVWADVWTSQEYMMTWPFSNSTPELKFYYWASRPEVERPGDVRAELERRKKDGKPVGYFGNDLPDLERREFADRLYQLQLEPFKQAPKPAYYLGGWEAVIQPVTKWVQKPPTTEECWLAQEELWVKRELLQTIQEAVDSAARFENVFLFSEVDHEYEGKYSEKEKTLPSGVRARQISANPNWELELILVEKEKKELEKKDEKPDPEKEGKPADDKKPAEEKKPADGEKPPDGDKAGPKKFLVISPKSRLKNINDDKKQLKLEGLHFRLEQLNSKDEVTAQLDLHVKGKPVDWKKSIEITDQWIVMERFDFKQPMRVTLVEDKSDLPPKNVEAWHRLRNPNWELELLLEKDKTGKLQISGETKVTNIHPHHRTLHFNGVEFHIRQERSQEPTKLRFQNDPLPWGATAKLGKPLPVTNINPEKPLLVEQLFDWANSPVKRIDEIRLGYNSHRTARKTLEPAKSFPKDTTVTTTPAADPPLPGGVVEGKGELASTTKTPNGLEKNRYYEATNQVRRLPLGVVLVVDQGYIPFVEAAFTNSKLRIQMTQVHYQRIRGVKPYEEEKDPTKTGEKPPIGKPAKFPKGFPGIEDGGDRLPPKTKGGFIGPGPGPGGGPDPALDDFGDDPNLVQLSIYGIASLYERYPPKPGGSESGGNPPPP